MWVYEFAAVHHRPFFIVWEFLRHWYVKARVNASDYVARSLCRTTGHRMALRLNICLATLRRRFVRWAGLGVHIQISVSLRWSYLSVCICGGDFRVSCVDFSSPYPRV